MAQKKSLRSRIATAILTAVLLGVTFAAPASAQLGNSAASADSSMTTPNSQASAPAREAGRKEKPTTPDVARRNSPGWPITVLAWLFVVAAAVVAYYQAKYREP